MAGVRLSGWSEIERGWSEIERGGATSSSSELRRRSYTVIADGKHPGLIEEGRNRYREKREGTGE